MGTDQKDTVDIVRFDCVGDEASVDNNPLDPGTSRKVFKSS